MYSSSSVKRTSSSASSVKRTSSSASSVKRTSSRAGTSVREGYSALSRTMWRSRCGKGMEMWLRLRVS